VGVVRVNGFSSACERVRGRRHDAATGAASCQNEHQQAREGGVLALAYVGGGGGGGGGGDGRGRHDGGGLALLGGAFAPPRVT
jgi:hypothetical protein